MAFKYPNLQNIETHTAKVGKWEKYHKNNTTTFQYHRKDRAITIKFKERNKAYFIQVCVEGRRQQGPRRLPWRWHRNSHRICHWFTSLLFTWCNTNCCSWGWKSRFWKQSQSVHLSLSIRRAITLSYKAFQSSFNVVIIIYCGFLRE